MDDETRSTPAALLQCLRMLSEEAASMQMLGTYALLQDALTACRAEVEARPFEMKVISGAWVH